jgi:hypothetical protein
LSIKLAARRMAISGIMAKAYRLPAVIRTKERFKRTVRAPHARIRPMKQNKITLRVLH